MKIFKKLVRLIVNGASPVAKLSSRNELNTPKYVNYQLGDKISTHDLLFTLIQYEIVTSNLSESLNW